MMGARMSGSIGVVWACRVSPRGSGFVRSVRRGGVRWGGGEWRRGGEFGAEGKVRWGFGGRWRNFWGNGKCSLEIAGLRGDTRLYLTIGKCIRKGLLVRPQPTPKSRINSTTQIQFTNNAVLPIKCHHQLPSLPLPIPPKTHTHHLSYPTKGTDVRVSHQQTHPNPPSAYQPS